MSGLTLKSMTTAESEFFAEETLITISPNFSHPKLLFTSGSFGPLEAGDQCVVPLWLAITLRKRGKCIIVIPEWMSVTSLEQNILNEKSDEHFEPLQFHYKEISQLLLNYARDDVKEPDRVSALLQDIENIRMDRAKMGMLGMLLVPMDHFALTVIHSAVNYLSSITSCFLSEMANAVRQGNIITSINLKNIASIEILTIRRFLLESLAAMYLLIKIDDTPETSRSNSQSQDRDADNRQNNAARPLRRFR